MTAGKIPLELYIHIPFCAKKCGYCDFVSAPAGKRKQTAYVGALLAEIKEAAATSDWTSYEVVSIFFGGGTPSIIKASYIEEILFCIRDVFDVGEKAEISLEANPGTLTEEKLSVYKRAGINRISLGLQSADNRELALLGRIHTFEIFKESYRMVREAGFQNVNVDLMAALPEQTGESFLKSLQAVSELLPHPPEHISVYSLIIEEGTPFYDKYHKQAEARAEGEIDTAPLPTEEEERRMYYETCRFLQKKGYNRYEISNYARPGLSCRHNIGYWTGVSYLGFGLSAASYVNESRFVNTADLEYYIRTLENSAALEKIRREEEKVTADRAMEEFMFLGLRMMDGVSEADFKKRFGKSMKDIYGDVLERMTEEGLMESYRAYGDKRWCLTGAGIDVSNYVMSEFLL